VNTLQHVPCRTPTYAAQRTGQSLGASLYARTLSTEPLARPGRLVAISSIVGVPLLTATTAPQIQPLRSTCTRSFAVPPLPARLAPWGYSGASNCAPSEGAELGEVSAVTILPVQRASVDTLLADGQPARAFAAQPLRNFGPARSVGVTAR
jgi:hypothetical protein